MMHIIYCNAANKEKGSGINIQMCIRDSIYTVVSEAELLNIIINNKNNVPIYDQIYSQIKNQILSLIHISLPKSSILIILLLSIYPNILPSRT